MTIRTWTICWFRRFWRIPRIISVSLLVPMAIHAQNAGGADFAERYRARIAAAFDSFGYAPDLAVVVVRLGASPLILRFGGAAKNPEIRYPIASVSKAFTGLTAARLAEQGTIDLDESLASALPDAAFSSAIPADRIRVRDLLTHSHGLSNPGVEHRYLFSGMIDSSDVVEALRYTTLNAKAPPGSYSYSNLGYILFGLYLQRATGRDWRDLVGETARLAGMNTFTLRPSEIPAALASTPYYGALDDGPAAIGYRRSDENATPSGGVYATIEDMGRWITAWLDPSATGLTASSVGIPLQVQFARQSGQAPNLFQGYGFGWFVGEHRGRSYAQHSGGFFGTSAYAALLPEDGIGVFAVASEYPLSSALTGFVGQTALDMLLGLESGELPPPEEPHQMAEGGVGFFSNQRAQVYGTEWTLSLDRAAYAGEYVDSTYGKLTITVDGSGRWYATIGRLTATLRPGPSKDTAGGGLVPYNDEAFEFVVENGAVIGIRFRQGYFRH